MNYNLTFGRHNFRRILLIGFALLVIHCLSFGGLLLIVAVAAAAVALYRWSNELRPVRPEPFDMDGDEPAPQGWSGKDMP